MFNFTPIGPEVQLDRFRRNGRQWINSENMASYLLIDVGKQAFGVDDNHVASESNPCGYYVNLTALLKIFRD